jgi:hypothetical protein
LYNVAEAEVRYGIFLVYYSTPEVADPIAEWPIAGPVVDC